MDILSKTYVFKFAINKLCERQWKAFERSVSKAQRHAFDLHPLSTFQEELLGSAEHCDLTWNWIVV